ncbi:serine hydrolase domain-containing protein [Kitasatospora viridis]|uniref:D-alanyl-D-alanine carboxypeptidase n=1 Tax=Kitasatospora viridis TaxID=281105 RepID=A0A561T651_9ACTN|nr:serine hydrolase domain-containing protein [Kitasatospora viridis]TWF82595.1 D-alanyl-D-alanine carboxypeptidase [Kitasatospora viridis]
MRTRNPRRRGAAVLVAALAALAALTCAPAAGAATVEPGSLQGEVNAIRATGYDGVVAEATGPGGHHYATAGQADTATGAPARPDDAFRIASATKSFTATVLLQLVGEGRLSLDDTVEHWLPGVVSGNGNDGSRITVRQLLQHTSGIYNYTDDLPQFSSEAGFLANRFTTYTPAQLVAVAMRHAPAFAPGTGWKYSNTNYILAGMIIDRVTRHSWQDEVRTRIIQPLGLRHTDIPGTDPFITGPYLHGYSGFGTGPTIDVTAFNPTAGDAAAEITSTTADLTRFYTALMRGRLLAPAQLAEMETTVPAPIWPGARYGLGLWWVPLSCGGGYYGHSGGAPGYNTLVGATPDGRRAAVVASTGDGGAGSQAAVDTLLDRQLCQAGPA